MNVWPAFSSDPTPGDHIVAQFAYLAINPLSGDLYVAWAESTTAPPDRNLDIWMMHYDESAGVWSDPFHAFGNPKVPCSDEYFPWIECDSSGRLHMTCMSSRGCLPDWCDQEDPACDLAEAYYAYSDNDGATWTAERLTCESFDSAEIDGHERRNYMGDYIGLGISGYMAYPVYPVGVPFTGASEIHTRPINRCGADWNNDGEVNNADYDAFVADFVDANTLADFNNDCVQDAEDRVDFLNAYWAGCP